MRPWIVPMAVMICLVMGCTPKELRTAKIEMGTVTRPRQNPDLPRVQRNLEEALRLYPDNAEVYHYWGWLQALQGNIDQMAAALAKSDSLSPKFKAQNDLVRQTKWQELFERAKNQANAKEYDSALENFINSGVAWPERFESWVNAAVVALQLGEKTRALELARKAYQVAPESTVVIETYARACTENGDYAAAEDAYRRLLRKDPNNAEFWFQLGNIARTRGDTAKTLENYRRGLEIDSANADGWFNIALLYFQRKDYCLAADGFHKVVKLLPADNEAKINYLLSVIKCAEGDTVSSRAALNQDRFQMARAELESITEAQPQNCDAWRLLLQVYVQLKMKTQAEAALKRLEQCEAAAKSK